MTDQEIRRVDELLTELVELVETARSVPMSGSCVVPREHTLDLLDDLREVLPPEMAQARRIVAQGDELLAATRTEMTELRERTAAEVASERTAAAASARDYTEAAEEHAAELISQARVEAARLVDEGQAENARLLSSAGVHEAATAAAEKLREESEASVRAARAAADEYAAQVRGEADHYATSLRVSADDYAERTLGEIVATLQRSAATAERGRAELAARQEPRRAPQLPDAADPGGAAVAEIFDGQAAN